MYLGNVICKAKQLFGICLNHHTLTTAQKASGGGKAGHTINISAPITIIGPVADQGNLSAILAEHAHEIARQVRRAFEIQFEQEAIV